MAELVLWSTPGALRLELRGEPGRTLSRAWCCAGVRGARVRAASWALADIGGDMGLRVMLLRDESPRVWCSGRMCAAQLHGSQQGE